MTWEEDFDKMKKKAYEIVSPRLSEIYGEFNEEKISYEPGMKPDSMTVSYSEKVRVSERTVITKGVRFTVDLDLEEIIKELHTK
ncbi:MAG: hypothetical protein HZB68_01400 [Candidatus Aenigmarchaeota archaeon]|nr:hypothetical protein [Candidatus Aenigmarchaeota archaeon]